MAGIGRVYTLAYVADMLGEDADWIAEVTDELGPEAGHLWIHDVGDHHIEAFTDAGIDSLVDVIGEYRNNPGLTPQPPPKK